MIRLPPFTVPGTAAPTADTGRVHRIALASVIANEPTVLGLSNATWTTLHTSWPGSSYALGWSPATQAGKTAPAHVGSNTLNTADVWIVPANRIDAAVTNAGDDTAFQGVNAGIVLLMMRFLGT